MNEDNSCMIYATFLARACAQAAALPRGARLEVEAIAVRPSCSRNPHSTRCAAPPIW